MIPYALIIEERRRRERDERESAQQIPLYAPQPAVDRLQERKPKSPHNTTRESERGALIVDLDTFETHRL